MVPRSRRAVDQSFSSAVDHAANGAGSFAAQRLNPFGNSLFALSADNGVNPWILFQNPSRGRRGSRAAEQKDRFGLFAGEPAHGVNHGGQHVDETGNSDDRLMPRQKVGQL